MLQSPYSVLHFGTRLMRCGSVARPSRFSLANDHVGGRAHRNIASIGRRFIENSDEKATGCMYPGTAFRPIMQGKLHRGSIYTYAGTNAGEKHLLLWGCSTSIVKLVVWRCQEFSGPRRYTRQTVYQVVGWICTVSLWRSSRTRHV
jgi:hypothetical protein